MKRRSSFVFPLKPVAASAIFLSGLAILLLITSALFVPKNNLAEFGMEEIGANGILGEQDHSIDVLIIGDSEAYSSISPMEMWQAHGFTSYVCATSAQQLTTSFAFLKQAFRHQSPKVVVLETNAIYRNVTMSQSLMSRLESLFSVFRYHNRWKSFRFSELLVTPQYTWTDDFKGYVYNTAVEAASPGVAMQPTDQVEAIPPLNREYVAAMAEFCRQHDTQLLLVSTSSTLNWNMRRHNGIAALAQELGLTYYDLNLDNPAGIDWSSDTRDRGDHLNFSGAFKVSAWLGKTLSETFPLNRQYDEAIVRRWNEALQRYLTVTGQQS